MCDVEMQICTDRLVIGRKERKEKKQMSISKSFSKVNVNGRCLISKKKKKNKSEELPKPKCTECGHHHEYCTSKEKVKT